MTVLEAMTHRYSRAAYPMCSVHSGGRESFQHRMDSRGSDLEVSKSNMGHPNRRWTKQIKRVLARLWIVRRNIFLVLKKKRNSVFKSRSDRNYSG